MVLEQAGLVHRIVTDGEFARFELAEDLTEHHHHLICANCGMVEDVPASAGLEQSVQTAATQIARSTGFHTQRHRVDLVGAVCVLRSAAYCPPPASPAPWPGSRARSGAPGRRHRRR